MKAKAILAFMVFLFGCKNEDKNFFFGSIDYKIDYQHFGNELIKVFGDSMTIHVSTNGNIIKNYHNPNPQGVDFEFYDLMGSKYYFKATSSDTIYYYDSRVDNTILTKYQATKGKNEIDILGYKCLELTISYQAEVNANIRPFKYIESYCPDLRINIDLYEDYKYEAINKIINETESISLKSVLIGNYDKRIIFEATRIEHNQLDNDIFDLKNYCKNCVVAEGTYF